MSDGRRYLARVREGSNSARAYEVTASRIVLWWLGTAFLVGVVTALGSDAIGHVPGPALRLVGSELVIIAAGVAVLRSVSRTHGRPIRSVLSADGTFQPGRVLLGAAAWLAPFAALLGLSGASGGEVHLSWPDQGGAVWIVALALLPLQAAAEEVLFRGYLTQSLGLIVNSRVLLVLLVSLLFALAHAGSAPWWTLSAQFALGVAASAAVLRDGRLEAAIGAHTANNLLALALHGPAPRVEPVPHGGELAALLAHGAGILLVNACFGVAFYALTGGANLLRSRARRSDGS